MPNITPTASDEQSLAGIDSAFARHRAIAAAGGHEGATLFPTLRLLVITCLDARVDPAHVLGLELGEALVLRNNGGRVTPQVINDLAYVSQLAEAARPEGRLLEVAVIQHTQCGVARLADDAIRHQYAERIGADESGLREYAILDPAMLELARRRLARFGSRATALRGDLSELDQLELPRLPYRAAVSVQTMHPLRSRLGRRREVDGEPHRAGGPTPRSGRRASSSRAA